MRIVVRTALWSAVLFAVLVGTVLTSATVGPADIGVLGVAKAMLNGVAVPTSLQVDVATGTVGSAGIPLPTVDFGYASPFDFAVSDTDQTIVTSIRMPRILLGAVVGFSLASAGTVMQGFFRNPMADPSIIGVSSGAAVGAVATMAVPLAIPFGLQTAAFVGALVAAGAVYVIATEDGRTPVATLLLAGVAIQTFLGAVISYLLLHTGEGLNEAIVWLMGHLSRATWDDVTVTLPVAVVLFALLLVYARDLNVMLLGEEDAHALGIDVERTKRLLLAGSSVITAAAVAVAGVIGFVGLIVPHTMRLVVGPDHRILLPVSALAGASFLVAADTFARAGPVEVPVGIVTAAIGAPFFLLLLRRKEVHAL
jgi:iron complex transport system permease protein